MPPADLYLWIRDTIKELYARNVELVKKGISILQVGVPTSQNCSSERTRVGAVWKMSRIFREISCGHIPCKLKDENLQRFSPNFHCTFHPSLAQISPELRSGGQLA